jgi:hypothetical protein
MNYAEIVRQKLNEGFTTCKEIAHSIGMDYNSKSYPALKSAFGRFKNGETLKEKPEKKVEVPKTTSELIAIDFGKRAESAKVKELNQKYNHLLAEYENSEKRFDALINIKQPVQITRIEPILSESKNEAIPIIQLSDCHFEESVDGQTINNLNDYNLEIATIRWNKIIQNSLKMIHHERNNSDIKQMVLWLGGDFITGNIHTELRESNLLSPTQATRFAKEKIITAINFYLEHGKFDKIIIPCNYGNHGRTEKEKFISTGYRNSYEWMMYNDIADYFSNNKKVEFIIANGIYVYLDIMGYMNRFFHGDYIRYQGGIGGLTVPLIKSIQRMNQQQVADYNFMGHYHQRWQATKDCFVNGSLIGYNAYAQSIGASPEEPQQGLNMLNKKYGMVSSMSIFCR